MNISNRLKLIWLWLIEKVLFPLWLWLERLNAKVEERKPVKAKRGRVRMKCQR